MTPHSHPFSHAYNTNTVHRTLKVKKIKRRRKCETNQQTNKKLHTRFVQAKIALR